MVGWRLLCVCGSCFGSSTWIYEFTIRSAKSLALNGNFRWIKKISYVFSSVKRIFMLYDLLHHCLATNARSVPTYMDMLHQFWAYMPIWKSTCIVIAHRYVFFVVRHSMNSPFMAPICRYIAIKCSKYASHAYKCARIADDILPEQINRFVNLFKFAFQISKTTAKSSKYWHC